MAYTATDVKNLRERTGAGMMDCKKAMDETGGDMEAAVDLLRAKGLAAVAKKSSRTAAEGLRYRDFLVVALILEKDQLFPDNWIYVHTPGVKVGRIQNFNNWSPHLVPDVGMTCLGLEYFCFEGDGLWSMADADLVELPSTGFITDLTLRHERRLHQRRPQDDS